MARQLRWPPDSAEFNAFELTPVRLPIPADWWNLRWAAHLTPATVFHASLTGRLTPESGTVKCLYLAAREATAFYEIYGDDIARAKESGATLVLSKQELVGRVYATTPGGSPIALYDLTTEGSAKKIGMDLATLYSGEIERPRRFAQRLHDHPARFDGIRYISRHTQGPCLVLWPTYTPALATLGLTRHSTLWDHATLSEATPAGSLRLFDDDLGVAAP
jgi:hypothetical protein